AARMPAVRARPGQSPDRPSPRAAPVARRASAPARNACCGAHPMACRGSIRPRAAARAASAAPAPRPAPPARCCTRARVPGTCARWLPMPACPAPASSAPAAARSAPNRRSGYRPAAAAWPWSRPRAAPAAAPAPAYARPARSRWPRLKRRPAHEPAGRGQHRFVRAPAPRRCLAGTARGGGRRARAGTGHRRRHPQRGAVRDRRPLPGDGPGRTPARGARRAERAAGLPPRRAVRRPGRARSPAPCQWSFRMSTTRRDFIRTSAIATAAAAAGLPLPGGGTNVVTEGDQVQLKWSKAPCRYCGTGCGVNVAVRDGRVVATHGDVHAEVNRGINCVKGYFLSKVLYGADRLTTPLLRKKNGAYDKDGDFTPVSWDEAFDVMAEQFKRVLRAKGGEGIGMFGSGQWTIWEGYAATKLMRAGFRSNHLDPNARHCMASAAYGFMRTFGMDEPMGCYDDIEAADAFVLWGSNMAEMHPILWTRVTDRRLSHPHVKVAVLSTFEHRSFELADIPVVFKPQTDLVILNYIANHI